MNTNEINKICEENIGLVYMVVNKIKCKYDREDLISEGMIGLFNGAKTYDKTKNIKLSTYLTTCIKNEISKYLIANGRYKRKSQEEAISLNGLVGAEDDKELINIIEVDYNLEEHVLNKIEMENLLKNLDTYLTEREAIIIKGLYLIGKSQKEIGKELNLSQTQIMNDKNKALCKLRYKLRK